MIPTMYSTARIVPSSLRFARFAGRRRAAPVDEALRLSWTRLNRHEVWPITASVVRSVT